MPDGTDIFPMDERRNHRDLRVERLTGQTFSGPAAIYWIRTTVGWVEVYMPLDGVNQPVTRADAERLIDETLFPAAA